VTEAAVAKRRSTGKRLGRFELVRELGRGAQATVWLAHDARLQREVALKLFDITSSAPEERDQWLHEARAVGSISHPHIVPVFEADEDGGRPYLVFEYVPGPTLAQRRRERALWPAREAAQLMLGVLDALAAAHAQGVVHRDLKPSNVLLGEDGRARVMDFGIAARVAAGGDGRIVGTAGYMSPEAARAGAPHPSMDVFAAGVMLGELLAGKPLMRESDPWRYVQRVQAEDVALPAELRIDEALRGIVARSLARDPAKRYGDARDLHRALQAWLEPRGASAPEASHGTLEFLLRRMRHKSDFPALSDSILRIQRLASSETANLSSLADEVLNDVALTAKLLRMVNSVHFASAGSGHITTVSRAVALVGFAGIRNMAMAVLLLEHMADKGHASQLRREFLRALAAAALAAELEPRARESEEAFLATMLQDLGRLLTEYYFPEEAVQIRQLLAGADGAAEHDAAALRVLGISQDELGAGVARAWGLPETLQKAMRRPGGDPPERGAPPGVERLRWLGRLANSIVDAELHHGDRGEQRQAIEVLAARHGPALDLSVASVSAASDAGRARLATLARAMGLQLPRSGAASRLLPGAAQRKSAAQPATTTGTGTSGAPGTATAGDANDGADAAAATDIACTQLRQAQAAFQEGLAGTAKAPLTDLLQQLMQTVRDALGCRAVVFCLRDPKSQELVPCIAVGLTPSARFRIVPQASGDLFAAVCARAVDTLIADSTAVAVRLPAWYREHHRAGSFLLLPLAIKGVPLGLIYADSEAANSLKPSEELLNAMRALRDAIVAGFSARGAR
jgi:serine/threonine protein kinase